MAEKTLADIGKFLDDVQRSVFGKETMRVVGEQIADIVKKRVKSGYGVNSDTADKPSQRKLAPLSESYKKARKRLGVTGSFASPVISNLTNTGQLLDSFSVKAKQGEVTVSIPNTQRKDGLTNREVADYVREKRPFFALTSPEVKIVEQIIRDKIRTSFKKNL